MRESASLPKNEAPGLDSNTEYRKTLLQDDKVYEFLSQVQCIDNAGEGIALLSQNKVVLECIIEEKCLGLEEAAEQEAILNHPDYGAFYLMLIRKLRGMLQAHEILASGLVASNKSSVARDMMVGVLKEGGLPRIKASRIGKAIAKIVCWTQKQLSAIPFSDAIGSVIKLVMQLPAEWDRHMALARVADFSTLACLENNAGSPYQTIERFARVLVRHRVRLESLERADAGFLEQPKTFSWCKRAMKHLLFDPGTTPDKEKACFAADAAIANIMKPPDETALSEILESSALRGDVPLHAALAASCLEKSLREVQSLHEPVTPHDLSQSCARGSQSSAPGLGSVGGKKIAAVSPRSDAAPTSSVDLHRQIEELKVQVEALAVSKSDTASKAKVDKLENAVNKFAKQIGVDASGGGEESPPGWFLLLRILTRNTKTNTRRLPVN